jgi:uncharacterized protein DUF6221
MADDLHTRLRAAVEERLAVARAADQDVARWYATDIKDHGEPEVGAFIALHDPADAIRRYEAGLKLLDEFEEAKAFYDAPGNRSTPAGEVTGLWTAVKLLAESLSIQP